MKQGKKYFEKLCNVLKKNLSRIYTYTHCCNRLAVLPLVAETIFPAVFFLPLLMLPLLKPKMCPNNRCRFFYLAQAARVAQWARCLSFSSMMLPWRRLDGAGSRDDALSTVLKGTVNTGWSINRIRKKQQEKRNKLRNNQRGQDYVD